MNLAAFSALGSKRTFPAAQLARAGPRFRAKSVSSSNAIFQRNSRPNCMIFKSCSRSGKRYSCRSSTFRFEIEHKCHYRTPRGRKTLFLRSSDGVGEFERRSVSKSPGGPVWAIGAGFERQNVIAIISSLTCLKGLFYKPLSGFFREHPGSSGYCNLKCLLTGTGAGL